MRHGPVEFSPFAYASEWTNRPEYLNSETTSNSRDFLVLRNEFPVHDHREFVDAAVETLGKLGSGSATPKNFGEFPCIFPAYQGSDAREEFPTDSPHRQSGNEGRDFP